MTLGWEDVLGGAGRAWVLFMLLLLGCVTVVGVLEASRIGSEAVLTIPYLVGSLLGGTLAVGGLVSLATMIAGVPLAWLVARMLRRRRSMAVHVGVWAVFGLLVGPTVVAVIAVITGSASLLTTPYTPISAALTAVSVLYGWWRASRGARAEMPSAEPRSPIGLDRAFAED